MKNLKKVEDLTDTELLDELSLITDIYIASCMSTLQQSKRARKAAEDLLAELRQNDLIRARVFNLPDSVIIEIPGGHHNET